MEEEQWILVGGGWERGAPAALEQESTPLPTEKEPSLTPTARCFLPKPARYSSREDRSSTLVTAASITSITCEGYRGPNTILLPSHHSLEPRLLNQGGFSNAVAQEPR